MRNKIGITVIALLLMISAVGCTSVSPAMAINQGDIESAVKFQYYLDGDLLLVLDRQRSKIKDTSFKVVAGHVYYTQEQIFIKNQTRGVALKSERDKDGYVILTMAFTKDDTKTIKFKQDTLEPDSRFSIMFDKAADGTEILYYGGAYYTVGTNKKSLTDTISGFMPFTKKKTTSVSPSLPIKETVWVSRNRDDFIGRYVVFE